MEASEIIKMLERVDPHGEDPAIPAGIGNLCRLAEEALRAQSAEVERLKEQRDEAKVYLRGCMGHHFDDTPLLDIAKDVTKEFHRRAVASQSRDAELATLREVAGRLPKTADGVPTVPGVTIFFADGNVAREFRVDAIEFNGMVQLDTKGWVRAKWYYSTREAAAAALAGEGEDA